MIAASTDADRNFMAPPLVEHHVTLRRTGLSSSIFQERFDPDQCAARKLVLSW
jgi:hypothetical protein